jgi:hypothetical protein
MTAWQTALFLLCVALATCAQNLTGFAFALILLGLAGLFELAPLAEPANVATVLALANGLVALRRSGRTLDVPAFRDIALGSATGILAGVLLVGWLSANVTLALRVLLGLTVIACATVVLLQAAAVRPRQNHLHQWLTRTLCKMVRRLSIEHSIIQPSSLTPTKSNALASYCTENERTPTLPSLQLDRCPGTFMTQ